MLQNTQTLYGLKLAATDGDIGHVKDFYFDDKTWVIRYLVANTGSWLTGRLVLLTPHAFAKMDLDEKTLQLKVHKQQIENSPSIEAHRPVSRQYEVDYYNYYGWPAYWNGDAMWGLGSYPMVVPLPNGQMEAHQKHRHRDDKHLQSTRAVTGYAVQAVDGAIGTVSGFLVDERSWAIGELTVETGHWYAGHEIQISPQQVKRISYEDSKVFVKLTMADLQSAAEHELARAVD